MEVHCISYYQVSAISNISLQPPFHAPLTDSSYFYLYYFEGAGHSPTKDARRTTFMAAFWEENPHHGVDFQTLLSSNGNKRKAVKESKSAPRWPKDFPCIAIEEQKQHHPIAAISNKNGQNAITTLFGNEIWEEVSNANKNRMKPVEVDDGIDLMGEDVFTSCEGLLGLGMKAERQKY